LESTLEIDIASHIEVFICFVFDVDKTLAT